LLKIESDFTSLIGEPAVAQALWYGHRLQEAPGNALPAPAIFQKRFTEVLLGHPPHSRILALRKNVGVGPPKEGEAARPSETPEP
jgi:hypothetical protein